MAIGPFTFADGSSQANKDAVRPAFEMAADLIGGRLKPITIIFQPKARMPDWNEAEPGIQPAWGLWKGWNGKTGQREIWLWDHVFKSDDAVPLACHEIDHAYDELYLNDHPEIREAVMEKMHPVPVAWLQGRVWAKYPYECYAVHASGALFGIKPAYKKLLSRQIYTADYPAIRAALLS